MLFYTVPVLSILGFLGLIIYMAFDFKKNRFDNILNRIFFYSFISYLIIVSHLTIGFFNLPPKSSDLNIQLVPFRFIADWIIAHNGGDWLFWNSVKLTFYNLIMLTPLGIYLYLLFNYSYKKGVIFVFLTSLTIETLQLILSSFGLLIRRGFNIDDLLLNTLGGTFGIVIVHYLKKILNSKSAKNKVII